MTISVLHILGASVTLAILHFLFHMHNKFLIAATLRGVFERAAVYNDLPVQEVLNGKHSELVDRHIVSRFGPESFANRASNILRPVSHFLFILSYCVPLAIIATSWITHTGEVAFSPNAWWGVMVALTFWGVRQCIILGCYIVTGRFPGEVRLALTRGSA